MAKLHIIGGDTWSPGALDHRWYMYSSMALHAGRAAMRDQIFRTFLSPKTNIEEALFVPPLLYICTILTAPCRGLTKILENSNN